MIREIPVEVKRWKGIKENSIEHPLGYIMEGSNVWVISEGFPSHTTLNGFLKKTKNLLSEKDKIRILISISNTMMNLLKLDETFSHGHLCPKNIMVSYSLFKKY